VRCLERRLSEGRSNVVLKNGATSVRNEVNILGFTDLGHAGDGAVQNVQV